MLRCLLLSVLVLVLVLVLEKPHPNTRRETTPILYGNRYTGDCQKVLPAEEANQDFENENENEYEWISIEAPLEAGLETASTVLQFGNERLSGFYAYESILMPFMGKMPMLRKSAKSTRSHMGMVEGPEEIEPPSFAARLRSSERYPEAPPPVWVRWSER